MNSFLKWVLIFVQFTVTTLTAIFSVATVPLFVLMVWTVILYFDSLDSSHGGDGWMLAFVATSTLSLISVAATETLFFWLLKVWDIIPRNSAKIGITIFGNITLISILFFFIVIAGLSS